jgi:hypothetical protein
VAATKATATTAIVATKGTKGTKGIKGRGRVKAIISKTSVEKRK